MNWLKKILSSKLFYLVLLGFAVCSTIIIIVIVRQTNSANDEVILTTEETTIATTTEIIIGTPDGSGSGSGDDSMLLSFVIDDRHLITQNDIFWNEQNPEDKDDDLISENFIRVYK
ncbi:CLUMA_CG005006, isoform A [Clunio marinus]|uniref:CLUMA_CG005006, isoform A n=1 Tax=Clunio marinus TaxID=568069 RepID=A0A1J1HVF0_9DIPT|nr:CLUMA_CG005006, isoform A [Clunio marinus]